MPNPSHREPKQPNHPPEPCIPEPRHPEPPPLLPDPDLLIEHIEPPIPWPTSPTEDQG